MKVVNLSDYKNKMDNVEPEATDKGMSNNIKSNELRNELRNGAFFLYEPSKKLIKFDGSKQDIVGILKGIRNSLFMITNKLNQYNFKFLEENGFNNCYCPNFTKNLKGYTEDNDYCCSSLVLTGTFGQIIFYNKLNREILDYVDYYKNDGKHINVYSSKIINAWIEEGFALAHKYSDDSDEYSDVINVDNDFVWVEMRTLEEVQDFLVDKLCEDD